MIRNKRESKLVDKLAEFVESFQAEQETLEDTRCRDEDKVTRKINNLMCVVKKISAKV